MKTGVLGTLALWTGCFLISGAAAAAPCSASPTVLCLSGQRFAVEVQWKDFQGKTGQGQGVTLTPDTGYFWFFTDNNIELVVKVLDARAFNNKFWVFFGALSNVEYTLKVTDTATGAVKSYQNPLGQFASVGDTSAFPGATAGVAATHETVTTDGTPAAPGSLEAIRRFLDSAALGPSSASKAASAAVTPCSDGGAFLYLAGCRFRLEVHWTDSSGRHGAGQPVQLTSDTGYFWFFTDNNVELIVKVLDARAFNGSFWVFYGALSNVEYTINVIDSVSGALHTYKNPQQTFASVGDTSAFRGGFPITVETDPARAASVAISAAAGGSVSTTGADGTVYTLEIPPNSLLNDETVRMTPARSTGSFPFAGGLVAGVDLQPSGVALFEGARLSIHTPASIPRSEETPVAWNGSGEDFFLFPPRPAAGDLQMTLYHLGGYGLTRGTEAERQAQLAREPVADDDLLSHRISPLLREGRAAAGGGVRFPSAGGSAERTESDWLGEERTIVERLLQDIKTEMLSTDEPARARELWTQSRAVLNRLREMGLDEESKLNPAYDQMFAQVLRKIGERCKDDPLAILEAGPFIQIMTNLLDETALPRAIAEIPAVLKCLTFKLRFESTIAGSSKGVGITYTVVAPEVTLRARLENFTRLVVDGVGPIDHTKAEWSGQDRKACPNPPTWISTPSTFFGKIQWDFAGSYNTPVPRGVRLEYDPGTPRCTITLVCNGGSIQDKDAWFPAYEGLRFLFNEVGCNRGCYVRDSWTLTGKKDPWAIKIASPVISANGGSLAEYTVFTLSHTPE